MQRISELSSSIKTFAGKNGRALLPGTGVLQPKALIRHTPMLTRRALCGRNTRMRMLAAFPVRDARMKHTDQMRIGPSGRAQSAIPLARAGAKEPIHVPDCLGWAVESFRRLCAPGSNCSANLYLCMPTAVMLMADFYAGHGTCLKLVRGLARVSTVQIFKLRYQSDSLLLRFAGNRKATNCAVQ
jgi:hypothetical protein